VTRKNEAAVIKTMICIFYKAVFAMGTLLLLNGCASLFWGGIERAFEQASNKVPPGFLRVTETRVYVSDGKDRSHRSVWSVNEVTGPGQAAGTIGYAKGSFILGSVICFKASDDRQLMIKFTEKAYVVLVERAMITGHQNSYKFFGDDPMIHSRHSIEKLESHGQINFASLYLGDGRAIKSFGFQVLRIERIQNHLSPEQYINFKKNLERRQESVQACKSLEF